MRNFIRKNKAYLLLSTFSRREMADFRELITSPYYNRSKKVIKLYDVIRYHHPGFNSRSLDNEVIYRKIFAKERTSVKVINNLFTKLIKLANLFICTTNFSKNQMLQNNCLLDEYRSRGLDSMLINTARKMLSSNDMNKEQETVNYFYLYNYYFQLVEFEYRTMLFGKEKNISKHLSELYKLLGSYYYHNLIKIFARITVSAYTDPGRIDESLIGVLNEIGLIFSNVRHPARAFFRSLALNFMENKPLNYRKFRKELDRVKDSITNEDYDIGLIILNSYFLPVIDEENKQLVSERFELVRLMAERRTWLTIGGEFVEQTFSYAVNSGLKAGELEWTEKFIKNYSRYINKQHRADAVNYALARLFYEKARAESYDKYKYFEIAREYLYQFRTKDLFRKLKTFELDTLILFETEQYDQLFYHCDNYVHYLNNHLDTVDSVFYSGHLAFADFAAKLAKLTVDRSSKSACLFKTRIEGTRNCLNKSWLIEKADKIILQP